jgi:predicted ribosome quality control (RQC) complex YloA/Tae2 family protein
MRRGESIAKARKADAEKALDAVEAIAAHLPFADDEALDAMQARLDAILPREIRRAAAPKEERERALAHRTFEAQSGRILVGRGAAHNDALTFRVAKPHHLWMHARGVAGAHVIVPLPRDRSCPPDLLIDAAHLAAHFSDARGEAVVEIAHAPRKWVRKPRGAPPGLVVVDREKVLVLRVEPDRLARLLAREI